MTDPERVLIYFKAMPANVLAEIFFVRLIDGDLYYLGDYKKLTKLQIGRMWPAIAAYLSR